jgi:hypothetical protein
VLTLSANNKNTIMWHLDASFAAHNDKKSHTGATMTLGGGAVPSVSTKQKVNTRSSTEAELISIDDIIAKILWSKLFLKEQSYKINQNIIFCDNVSSMKL